MTDITIAQTAPVLVAMICASLYRAVFIKNLLGYLAEKILLLNTTNFRGDYHTVRTSLQA